MLRYLFLLTLFVGSFVRLGAQAFTFAPALLKFDGFEGQRSSGEVRIVGGTPNFDPSQLVLENAQGLSVAIEGDRLRLTYDHRWVSRFDSYFSDWTSVSVRYGTTSHQIPVSLRTYRRPNDYSYILLSPDSRVVYAIGGSRLWLLDSVTGQLKAASDLPSLAESGSTADRRVLYLSEDGNLISLYNAIGQTLLRFDAQTLAPSSSLRIPQDLEAPAKIYYRTFFAEQAGKLYFIRYDFDPYASPVGSTVEVRDSLDGSLIQSRRLPFPSENGNLSHYELHELAIHPWRKEAWILARTVAVASGSALQLLRLSLKPDGTLGEATAPALPVAHQNDPYVDSWRTTDMIYTHRIGFGFSLPRRVATIGSAFLDDSGVEPRLLRTLPYRIRLSPRGDVGFASDGSAYDPFTGRKLPLRLNASNGFSAIRQFDATGTLALLAGPPPSLVDLPQAFISTPDGQQRQPAAGTFVAPLAELVWAPIPGSSGYRVYLAESPDLLASTAPDSSAFLGEVADPRLILEHPLTAGRVYHWRIDPVVGKRTLVGDIQSFAVSHARIAGTAATSDTVQSCEDREFTVPIMTSAPNTAWSVSSATPWLRVVAGEGAGPGSATISVNARDLAAGVATGTLLLTTEEGTVPFPVQVDVQRLKINEFAISPGSALVHTFSDVIEGGAILKRYILSIDTESERVTHGIRTESPGSVTLAPSLDAKSLFELRFDRIIERDPATLAERRTVPLPAEPPAGSPYVYRRLFPGPDGSFGIVLGDGSVSRFDPGAGSFSAPIIVPPATSFTRFDDTGALAAYQRVSLGLYARIRMPVSGLPETFQAANPVSPFVESTYPRGLIASSQPLRIAGDGLVMNADFTPLADLEDDITGLAVDGALALSLRLVYFGDNYSVARTKPPYAVAYVPATRKLIVNQSNERGRLDFVALDNLPEAPAPHPTVTTTGDTFFSVSLLRPAETYLVQVEYRPTGENRPWLRLSVYGDSFNVPDLLPKTDYEFRFRARDRDLKALTPRGPVHTFRTAVARPGLVNTPVNPGPQVVTLGTPLVLSFNVTGEDLVWEVDGLPDGLTFDPGTRTLAGTPAEPGRYQVKLIARNGGGEVTLTRDIWVPDPRTSAASARYHGLIDLDAGPLTGVWSIVRSGRSLTGTYRSALFTRSFKSSFAGSIFSEYRETIFTKVTYQGVDVTLRLVWDKLEDSINLIASTYDLEENFVGRTMEGTGQASRWQTGSRPYPHAARYTSLLRPGLSEGHPGPRGTGFFTATLRGDGQATLVGETSLGQKITQSLYAGDDGSLPFFQFTNPFLLIGILQIGEAQPILGPRMSGTLVWGKDEEPKGKWYREGFAQELIVRGAPLPPVTKSSPLFPFGNPSQQAWLTLSEGALPDFSKPVTQRLDLTSIAFAAPKSGTPANPNRVAVKFTPASGLVTGSASLIPPQGVKTVRSLSFRGQFVKDLEGDGRDVVEGYFLLKDGRGLLKSGSIKILE